MEIRTFGVVGAGLMGSGIADVCARSGLCTRVAESNEEALAAGRRRVERSLQRGHQGGKLRDEDVERITGCLTFSAQLDEFADCDIVIEAIVGLNAAYAFDLSGDEGGVYHIVLADGRGEAGPTAPEDPNITISMKDADFVDLATGKLDGTAAFMSGTLKIRGDMGLAMKLQGILRD